MSKNEDLLTPAQVGSMFGVDAKTVTRWTQSGRIPKDHIEHTLGGHRRYKRDLMEQLKVQFKKGKDDSDA